MTSFFGRQPYTTSPQAFGPLHPFLDEGTWQIVPGPSGVPAVEVELRFEASAEEVANPDMTVALLIDCSASMAPAWLNGEVRALASLVLRRLEWAGGLDLVFCRDQPAFVGRMMTEWDLQTACQVHSAGGQSRLAEGLRGAIQRYRTRPGLQLIVVTDGAFTDRQQVQDVIISELLPLLTPDNPYAFRLNFLEMGSDPNRLLLERLEETAAGGGVPIAMGHHSVHVHASHDHARLYTQLRRCYLGMGTRARVGRLDVPDEHSHHVAHVRQRHLQNWYPGENDTFTFLPLESSWLIEVAPTQARHVRLTLSWDPGGSPRFPPSLNLVIPYAPPKVRPTSALGAGLQWRWPWQSPEDIAREKRRQVDQALAWDAAQARAREDLKGLSRGGIPVQAQQRLAELRDDPNSLFTSNLDASEAALLRAGFRPLGLVSGSAVVHVGQPVAAATDCEVPVLSQAYDEATRLAVGRMRTELHILGAHGVVAVNFQIRRHEWGEKTIEVLVLGTAVGGPGPEPSAPFLCDLPGREWWALRRAGYEPCQLVWGHCGWFVCTTPDDEQTIRRWSNQELSRWSLGLSAARTRALRGAEAMARNEGAHGLVGVRLDRRLSKVHLEAPGLNPKAEHHILLVSLVATAIRPMATVARQVPPSTLVLSLLDGCLTPLHRKETGRE